MARSGEVFTPAYQYIGTVCYPNGRVYMKSRSTGLFEFGFWGEFTGIYAVYYLFFSFFRVCPFFGE